MRHERGWREKIAARTARRLQANLRRAAESEGGRSMADEATSATGPAQLTQEWCINMAKQEAAAGDPDSSAGAPARSLVERLRDSSGGHINGLYDREAADEIERLRADAERYRTWRANYTEKTNHVTDLSRALADAWTPQEVDSAIDAARAALENP